MDGRGPRRGAPGCGDDAMANEGELPAFKVRGQWRIRKVDFDRWMEAQAKAATSTPPKEGE